MYFDTYIIISLFLHNPETTVTKEIRTNEHFMREGGIQKKNEQA